MSQSLVLTGGLIVLYINNKPYKEVQSISLDVDYGEQEIYGIDCPWPQEIASNKVTVRGSVSGFRIKYSGGIQAINGRPLFTEIGASPYISVRITDRSTGEDIVFIPMAKISREKLTATAKGGYRLNFDFVGAIPYFALDRA